MCRGRGEAARAREVGLGGDGQPVCPAHLLPCEGFIPVYVSGVRYGWGGFALLTAILSVGTVLGMVVFTWLTLVGLEKLKLKWIERYESGVLGGLLCGLGLLVMFFEK